MPKKIFIISSCLNYGAPGRIVEQTGLLAQKKGWSVMVAHGSRKYNPSNLPHFAITSKLDEAIHALGARLFDMHGLLSTRQTKALIKQIEDFNPDIIHLHNIHGYYVNFSALFMYLNTLQIPIVWTLHDCWPFTGRCFNFDGAKCDRWKTRCYNCPAEKGYTVSPICDRSRTLFELKRGLFSAIPNLTIVSVSKWLDAYVKESFLKSHKTCVIHNGIDISSFQPCGYERLQAKYAVRNKTVVLGVAGPWSERKGLSDFYELRHILPNDHIIILVGLNDKQISALPKGIIGVSRTESQRELAEYYSMADCFVNMTYADTFPTVNLESLACGTPVITYRTGGSPEAINEKTGIVVEQGNVQAMADAILSLREHPLSSEDCRKRAEMLFDKDKCFEKYIELYDSLLHK